MVGNRVFVCGLVILCSALAGCIGAPFAAGDTQADTVGADAGAVAEQADSGTEDPSNVDSGTSDPLNADSGKNADAGADVDASPGVDARADARVDGGDEPHDDGVDAGSTADASPCGGGPVYLHHVGLMGLTWQDCVPTGTYDATQALAACATYAAAIGASVEATGVAICNAPDGNQGLCTESVYISAFTDAGTPVPSTFWTYEGNTVALQDGGAFATSVAGHVSHGLAEPIVTPEACTSAQDPSWD